jgi:hypothetical protein
MKNENDNEAIEELLVRSGDYLMERTAQYREQPVHISTARQDAPFRWRRVLVGTAAAATLSVTALAGSFIGGASSGKVDVAQAAWTATPTEPSQGDVDSIASDCRPLVEEMWKSYQVDKAVPKSAVIPSAVDFRGTTKLAVYFWEDTSAAVCFRFAGGAVALQNIGSNAMWKANDGGSMQPVTYTVDNQIIGLVWGDLPRISTGDFAVGLNQAERAEAIIPTLIPSVRRYVAWTPTTGDITVAFTNRTTGATSTVGPHKFPAPCLGSCLGNTPAVPVPGDPNATPGHHVGISEEIPPTMIACFDTSVCKP